MINKNIIINFGVPNTLKNLNLVFCFDDTFSKESFVGNNCHCKTNSTKFFLYDSGKERPIFTMDFYITNNHNPIYNILNSECRVHLQHIETSGMYRKQGIASYYIQKLINFCVNNNIYIISLEVCPYSEDNLNILNKNELTEFYTNFSTNEVKIHIIKY